VPAFFKKLKYPFQISKTALVAVGSPHTWPTLLGALVWLAELLAYRERVVCYPPRSVFHSGSLLIIHNTLMLLMCLLEINRSCWDSGWRCGGHI
jgi:SMC interacting uncharacterized protein involved in chromosome segregation